MSNTKVPRIETPAESLRRLLLEASAALERVKPHALTDAAQLGNAQGSLAAALEQLEELEPVDLDAPIPYTLTRAAGVQLVKVGT